jgi:hypothetical protein
VAYVEEGLHQVTESIDGCSIGRAKMTYGQPATIRDLAHQQLVHRLSLPFSSSRERTVALFTHVVGDYPILFVIEREDDCDQLLAVDTPYNPHRAPSSYPSTSSPSLSLICPPWPESRKT